MERNAEQRNRRLIFGGLAAIALLACVSVVLWLQFRPPLTADLRDYVVAYRVPDGTVTVSIDAESLLAALHLPSPYDDEHAADRYADTAAILQMTAQAEPLGSTAVRITVTADTETLAAHRIVLAPLTWETTLPAQSERPAGTVSSSQPLPAPTGSEPAKSPAADGVLLTSLIDENGRGYNLRAVCERVQQERDALLLSRYGETGSYLFEKTQVAFGYDGTQNCYQASYRAWADVENGKETTSTYFRIRIYGLTLENGAVTYRGSVESSFWRSEADAKQSPLDNTVVLSGGGMRAEGRAAFDQNGFVLFPDSPTSYRMANGVYWSPTYDALDEDMIWALTAVEGHSLANLLRYARKEIYARYYAGFDEKSEREFYEHYTQYGWYHELTPDRTADMTETERANIRLLREIQSLVEK